MTKPNLNTKVFDEYHAEFRCSKVITVRIYNRISECEFDSIISDHDPKFTYKKDIYKCWDVSRIMIRN